MQLRLDAAVERLNRAQLALDEGQADFAEQETRLRQMVVAAYEHGVHVLRPVGMPIEVKRWREGGHMMWQYIGFTARLEHVGPPETMPG